MKKHTALITGAGGALGQALSLRLAQQHQHIVLHDADLPLLEPIYDHIETETDCEPAMFPLNFKLAGATEYQQLAQVLQEYNYQLDTLVFNAASLPAFTPLKYFDPTQWYEVLQVNLNAHFHVLQACLPVLSEKAEVLLISDEAIDLPKPYYGAYAVAKAGLETLIKLLQSEQEGLQCRIERVPPFQSPLRQHLFPGADHSSLPTAEQVATTLYPF